MMIHNELGRLGESIAEDFLLEKGYQILDRNWRYLKCEIDILAIKENILAVVEVKTRTSDFFQPPEKAITKRKIKLLILGSEAYVYKKNLDVQVRFDVISIIKNREKTTIKHLKEAFFSFE